MVTQEQIQELVNEIAEGYQPEKIYLFGSYANGTPTVDSDIDLFIVKDTNAKWNERTKEIRKILRKYLYPFDIIIYTPLELENAMKKVMNIGKIAVNNGKLMYERV